MRMKRHCCLIHAWRVHHLARRIAVKVEHRSEWSMESRHGIRRPVAFAVVCVLPDHSQVKYWVACGGWTRSRVVKNRPFDFSYSRIKHRLARRILRSHP